MKYIRSLIVGKADLIPENLRTEFNGELYATNYNRAYLLTLVLLMISLVLLVSDYVSFGQGLWERSYGYKLLYYMHLILMIGLVLLVGIRFSVVKIFRSYALQDFHTVYTIFFVLFMLLVSAGVSSVDQLIHGQAIVFILAILVIAVSIYFIPGISMVIYSSAFLLFVLGINHFQENSDILRGHYINGTLVYILALVIARVFYNQRVEEFLNKKTILYQKAELEKKTKDQEATMDVLIKTQKHLVQSEKLAALGNLVAGIAHEVNTPLGIAVTAATHLNKSSKDIALLFKNNELKKSNLTDFLNNVEEGTMILESNLRKASDLIKSFKQVAVDQSNQSLRTFDMKGYLDEILLSLRPKIKYYKHEIIVECPPDLIINGYPGVISQIITNLIMNSFTHAFDQEDQGIITITIKKVGNKILLKYSDNGKGIPEEYQDKIFEPFFTTKRGDGGTGLGLHVVYNLVTKILKGKIRCESKVNVGTDFFLEFPMKEGERHGESNGQHVAS